MDDRLPRNQVSGRGYGRGRSTVANQYSLCRHGERANEEERTTSSSHQVRYERGRGRGYDSLPHS